MQAWPFQNPHQTARKASESLQQWIIHEIAQKGGWISFAHYMSLALYTPLLGYYSGGSSKLGKEGDFITAPEITPLFGAALANPVSELLAQTAPQIMEFGAGSGALARDLLLELKRKGTVVERYIIVELSGELRARQEACLRDFSQVEWINALPSSFSGVVLGNEVLDAMPVQLVTKTETDGGKSGLDGMARDSLFLHAMRTNHCLRKSTHKLQMPIRSQPAISPKYTLKPSVSCSLWAACLARANALQQF